MNLPKGCYKVFEAGRWCCIALRSAGGRDRSNWSLDRFGSVLIFHFICGLSSIFSCRFVCGLSGVLILRFVFVCFLLFFFFKKALGMVQIPPDDRVVGLFDDELVTVPIQDFAWSREERRRELVRGLVVADQYLVSRLKVAFLCVEAAVRSVFRCLFPS